MSHPQRPWVLLSNMTSLYKDLCAKSRQSHSSGERSTATSWKVKIPCHKRKEIIKCLDTFFLLRLKIQEFITKLYVFLIGIIVKVLLQNTDCTKNLCAKNINPSRTNLVCRSTGWNGVCEWEPDYIPVKF